MLTFLHAVTASLSRLLGALASTMTLNAADTAGTSELAGVGAVSLVVTFLTAVETGTGRDARVRAVGFVVALFAAVEASASTHGLLGTLASEVALLVAARQISAGILFETSGTGNLLAAGIVTDIVTSSTPIIAVIAVGSTTASEATSVEALGVRLRSLHTPSCIAC